MRPGRMTSSPRSTTGPEPSRATSGKAPAARTRPSSTQTAPFSTGGPSIVTSARALQIIGRPFGLPRHTGCTPPRRGATSPRVPGRISPAAAWSRAARARFSREWSSGICRRRRNPPRARPPGRRRGASLFHTCRSGAPPFFGNRRARAVPRDATPTRRARRDTGSRGQGEGPPTPRAKAPSRAGDSARFSAGGIFPRRRIWRSPAPLRDHGRRRGPRAPHPRDEEGKNPLLRGGRAVAPSAKSRRPASLAEPSLCSRRVVEIERLDLVEDDIGEERLRADGARVIELAPAQRIRAENRPAPPFDAQQNRYVFVTVQPVGDEERDGHDIRLRRQLPPIRGERLLLHVSARDLGITRIR